MLLQSPFSVVTSSVDGDVLGVLAASTDEFTMGRLARLIPHRSVSGIRNAAERLVDQGVVWSRDVGRIRTYTFNDAHILAEAIRAIPAAREELLTRMRSQVEQWPTAPLFGAIFGSAARGDMTVESDVDVFLLLPDDGEEEEWGATIGSLEEMITVWTGNDGRVVEVRAGDVMGGEHRTLVAEVRRDGIPFTGSRTALDGSSHR